jgi:Flp pilus assembly protein TadD
VAVPLGANVTAEKVARYPGQAVLLNELGNQLLQNGRPAEAEARYREAVRVDPDLAIAWNNLGVARAALGRHGGARSAYRQAIKLRPNYALAYYNLGAGYDTQGRYQKALRNYEKAIQLDRGMLDPRINPQILSNHHVPAILIQNYLDRGGTLFFPVESVYPKPPGK